LRPVAAEDRAFLHDLYVDTHRDEFAALGWPPAQLLSLLQAQCTAQDRYYASAFPHAEHSLVLIDGLVAGRLYVERTAAAIHLIDVSLVAEQRGRGSGTALLRMLQAEAADRGGPVQLSVRRGNPAARLYERLGFVEIASDEMYRQLEWRPDQSAKD
jgi:ribosomal protein S18 acetylase RimI-like enzyme